MAEKDRVQVPSRRKDGTPDQTDDYEIIGDPETAKAAIAEQLGQMKVSEADQARAAAQAAEEAAGQLTEEEQARKDEHDALMAEGEAEADAEVSSRVASSDAPAGKKATSRRSRQVETTAER